MFNTFKHKYLAISVFFSIVSGCSIYWYLEEKTSEIEKRNNVELVPRIVASKIVKAGSRVNHDDLAVRDLPSAYIGQDSYSLEQLSMVIGKLVIADMRPGELVTRLHLSDQEPQELASKIDAGYRAITIPVDQINSISGLLKPDDRIDLYVSFDHSGKRITALLVENISVLATGQSLNVSDDFGTNKNGLGFGTVTLSATAEQAVKIVAARQDGIITAVLTGRSPASHHQVDKALKKTGGDLAGLLGIPSTEKKEIQASVIYGDLVQQDQPNHLPFDFRQWVDESSSTP